MAESIYEIERKFLLSSLPPDIGELADRLIDIRQGWVGKKPFKVRIRESVDLSRSSQKSKGNPPRYFWGTKMGQGVTRIELEDSLEPDVFSFLWPKTKGKRVYKMRWMVPADDGLKWEVDKFRDRELFLAELEMPSAEYDLKIPKWLKPYIVREVTDEKEYNNSQMAR